MTYLSQVLLCAAVWIAGGLLVRAGWDWMRGGEDR